MTGRSALCAVAALLLPADAALAQPPAPSTNSASTSQPSPRGDTSATAVKPVTVAAKQPDYRRYIDRRSYSLTADLHATNGSIGDALRNIPSVDVNPQGDISLRGDSSVTIMVDGQPSALFRGRSRAAALEQIPADQYERVEVITNPSAAFKPDGTGGIINLISKKSRHQKPTATISVNGNTRGDYSVVASGTYASNGLSMTGVGAYYRVAQQWDQQNVETVIDPTSGQSAAVNAASVSRDKDWAAHGVGSVDYDVDSNTRLSANLSYDHVVNDTDLEGIYRSSAKTGLLAQDYDNADNQLFAASLFSGAASYRRELGGDDHEFDVNLQYSTTTFRLNDRQAFAYQLPVQPDLFQDLMSGSTQGVTDLKLEYRQPLPGQAKLLAGYELEYDQASSAHQGLLGTDAADAAAQPALNDRFSADQAAHDLYATYEHPFGRFDVMPGLRLEEVVVDTNQITQDLKDSMSYFQVYPTLHTSYRLSSAIQLTASYSRRVDRPDPSLLNPFRVYNNPLSFAEGNPRLKPAITDSYEAAFEYGEKSAYYLATLYFRDTRGLINQITENLGDGALLNTYGNIARSWNAGAELVANGPITKTLSYSLTGDAFWKELTNPDAPEGPPRAGAAFTFKPKLKWEPTANDFFQLNAYFNSRSPTAQGYASGYFYLDAGYRHNFSDRLSLVAQLHDPTNAVETTVIDTPTLKLRMLNRYHGRALSIGLTYDLGGTPKPAPKEIDFGGGGPGH